MSTHRTRCPSSAKAAARLSVVVVLATPPFWLAKAMTLALPVTRAPIAVGENPSARAIRTIGRESFSRLACRHDGGGRAQLPAGGRADRDLRRSGRGRQDDDVGGP